jgi:hypothetical protein
MRRGAQSQTDEGSCLFEPQASLHETPAGPSTTGCPQRSGGTQAPGSPFFSRGFFGETKKCRSPAAATERHRNYAQEAVLKSTEGFDRLSPTVEQKCGSWRFQRESKIQQASRSLFRQDSSGKTTSQTISIASLRDRVGLGAFNQIADFCCRAKRWDASVQRPFGKPQ